MTRIVHIIRLDYWNRATINTNHLSQLLLTTDSVLIDLNV